MSYSNVEFETILSRADKWIMLMANLPKQCIFIHMHEDAMKSFCFAVHVSQILEKITEKFFSYFFKLFSNIILYSKDE